MVTGKILCGNADALKALGDTEKCTFQITDSKGFFVVDRNRFITVRIWFFTATAYQILH